MCELKPIAGTVGKGEAMKTFIRFAPVLPVFRIGLTVADVTGCVFAKLSSPNMAVLDFITDCGRFFARQW